MTTAADRFLPYRLVDMTGRPWRLAPKRDGYLLINQVPVPQPVKAKPVAMATLVEMFGPIREVVHSPQHEIDKLAHQYCLAGRLAAGSMLVGLWLTVERMDRDGLPPELLAAGSPSSDESRYLCSPEALELGGVLMNVHTQWSTAATAATMRQIEQWMTMPDYFTEIAGSLAWAFACAASKMPYGVDSLVTPRVAQCEETLKYLSSRVRAESLV